MALIDVSYVHVAQRFGDRVDHALDFAAEGIGRAPNRDADVDFSLRGDRERRGGQRKNENDQTQNNLLHGNPFLIIPEEPEETIMSHQPSLPGTGLRVAFVTMHTSPLERAGTADAGGMNVLIAALARAQIGRAHV